MSNIYVCDGQVSTKWTYNTSELSEENYRYINYIFLHCFLHTVTMCALRNKSNSEPFIFPEKPGQLLHVQSITIVTYLSPFQKNNFYKGSNKEELKNFAKNLILIYIRLGK